LFVGLLTCACSFVCVCLLVCLFVCLCLFICVYLFVVCLSFVLFAFSVQTQCAGIQSRTRKYTQHTHPHNCTHTQYKQPQTRHTNKHTHTHTHTPHKHTPNGAKEAMSPTRNKIIIQSSVSSLESECVFCGS